MMPGQQLLVWQKAEAFLCIGPKRQYKCKRSSAGSCLAIRRGNTRARALSGTACFSMTSTMQQGRTLRSWQQCWQASSKVAVACCPKDGALDMLKHAPVSKPDGLKSSPSKVTQRADTSLLKARRRAVAASCDQ